MTEREMVTNDKLKYASKDIWGIIITAAAAALCVAIDILLKEEKEDENLETGTRRTSEKNGNR